MTTATAALAPVMVALAAVTASGACGRAPAPAQATAEDLAAYVAGLAARDPEAVARELAGWPLDRGLWQRTVVDPYRDRWEQLAPDGRLRALAGALRPGAVTARRHYARDPRLTPRQLWQRWALPPLYPSFVVELDGRPLDTVFLHDGVRWRALVGLDELIEGAVRSLDPGCVAHLAGAVASGDCASAGWAVADAALRTDRARLARSCHIAATLCGKRSP
jgi:hypothetical protein